MDDFQNKYVQLQKSDKNNLIYYISYREFWKLKPKYE